MLPANPLLTMAQDWEFTQAGYVFYTAGQTQPYWGEGTDQFYMTGQRHNPSDVLPFKPYTLNTDRGGRKGEERAILRVTRSQLRHGEVPLAGVLVPDAKGDNTAASSTDQLDCWSYLWTKTVYVARRTIAICELQNRCGVSQLHSRVLFQQYFVDHYNRAESTKLNQVLIDVFEDCIKMKCITNHILLFARLYMFSAVCEEGLYNVYFKPEEDAVALGNTANKYTTLTALFDNKQNQEEMTATDESDLSVKANNEADTDDVFVISNKRSDNKETVSLTQALGCKANTTRTEKPRTQIKSLTVRTKDSFSMPTDTLTSGEVDFTSSDAQNSVS
ncbi:hypothetical protein J6590_041193 [Homalodisca vitripennis]|nr:hypothetical protein J6590_041193 [Homalodisca vitripennis]